MTTSQHAGRRFFWSKLLFVHRLFGSVGTIATNHFLVFADWEALSLELLNVLETRKNLVLDDKVGLHLVLAAFLYSERLRLERIQSAGL